MTHLILILVSGLRDETGHDLPAILHNAACCNPAQSVRSMLLFAGGQVMQAIDGEASEIRRELQRLLRCSYFSDCVVLNEERSQGHSLERTSLGAQQLPCAVHEMLPANVAFFPLSASAVEQQVRAGIARNLLRQFAADYA